MDPLRQIEAFVAVVQAGSYVRAAERRDTSKAVLSRQVLDLEARLGTRLLNRTTRKLSLTETGAVYFERCRQILDDLQDADAAASATTAAARGRLRINAPSRVPKPRPSGRAIAAGSRAMAAIAAMPSHAGQCCGASKRRGNGKESDIRAFYRARHARYASRPRTEP